jgi:hypothetical protein
MILSKRFVNVRRNRIPPWFRVHVASSSFLTFWSVVATYRLCLPSRQEFQLLKVLVEVNRHAHTKAIQVKKS